MCETLPAFELLLIEDEAADAYLVKRALKKSKMLVNFHHVFNGVEALEYIRQGDSPHPDLILLDLNMPLMNGREFLAELKKDQSLQHIPVVILTTSDVEEDVVRTYQLGASGYITKPVDLRQFMEAIHQLEQYWFALVKLPGDRT